MADQVQKVTIQLILQDLFSGNAAKVQSASKAITSALREIGGFNFSNLAGAALGIGGGLGIASILEKALGYAREWEDSEAKLSAALGGNLTQLRQINDAISQVSKTSVFAEQELASAAQHMIERGIPVAQIPKALQVVADTASALQKPLDEVADNVAQTFGGVVPREIGRSVPALKDLSVEALRSGGALDILGQRYHGLAAEFTASSIGQEKAALRDIAQSWRDIGVALLPIEQTILPKVAEEMKAVAEPFKPDTLVTWGNVLKEILATMAARIAQEGAFATSLLIVQPLKLANDGLKDLFYNLKALGIDAISYLVQNFKTQITSIAGDIDKLTARLPAWMGGKTNLTGSVSGLGDSLASGATQANAAAKGAHSDFMGDLSRNAWSTASGEASEAYRETRDWVEKALGADAGVQQTVDAQNAAQKLQDAADKRQQTTTQTNTGENDTLGTLQKETAELTKQLEVRKLRATATIDGGGPAGTKATGDADLAEQKIQQQQELNQLIADGFTKSQQDDLVQVQILETKAKTVEVTRQQAEAEIQVLEAAKAAYQAVVEHNANLLKAGQITSLQARQSDTTALDTYQAKVKEANAAISDLLAKGVLSPEQAAQIQQQIQTIEEKTKEVNSQWQQDAAEMGRALNEGLVRSLTDAETKAKTLKQALKDLAKSLLTDLLNIENQHLVDMILGGGTGSGGEGGGKSGSGGQGGGLLGLIDKLFTPSGKNTQPSGSAGAVSSVSAPAASAASGSTPSTPGAGGGAGGFSLGGAVNSVEGGIGDVVQGAGNVIGSVASGVGQAAAGDASSAASAIGPIIGGLLSFFDTGGYTGDGNPKAVAGIVHRGEYVLNADTVKALGGPSNVRTAVHAVSARMFPSLSVRSAHLSTSGGGDVVGKMSAGIEAAMERGIKHVGTLPAVVAFGNDTADQLFQTHWNSQLNALMSSKNYARKMGAIMKPYTK